MTSLNKRFFAIHHRHNTQNFRILLRVVMVAQDLSTKHLHLIKITIAVDPVKGLIVW